MTDQNAKGWPRVHYSHSIGSHELGLELSAQLGRPLTENDQQAIDKAMHELQVELKAETQRLDPKNAEWKSAWLAKARAMFDASGLAPIYMREIDNEYCGPKCCPHRVWLLVTTRFGVIKVGWRKSVMVVDWSASDLTAESGMLFASEEVTKGDRMIHAWSYEKATEYLRRLGEAATA